MRSTTIGPDVPISNSRAKCPSPCVRQNCTEPRNQTHLFANEAIFPDFSRLFEALACHVSMIGYATATRFGAVCEVSRMKQFCIALTLSLLGATASVYAGLSEDIRALIGDKAFAKAEMGVQV